MTHYVVTQFHWISAADAVAAIAVMEAGLSEPYAAVAVEAPDDACGPPMPGGFVITEDHEPGCLHSPGSLN